MKTAFLVSILVTAAFQLASATQISVSAGRTAIDASNNVLADGDIFLIGTFSTPAAISNSGSITSIMSSAGWSQFDSPASLTIGTTFGNGGKLFGTLTDNTAAATAFNGKLLYVWVFNTNSVNSATQQGIYGASDWVFPINNSGIGDSLTIDTNDALVSAINGVGSVTASNLKLVQVVPEPSPWSLMSVAGFALVFYTLRRKLRIS